MPAKPFFITTPIYYINSVPHVGHAYTQIAADARARFERLQGREVYFLTGTDENALKVARVAQEQGRDPLEFCDELAQAFKDVWDYLQISYDDFIRTTEARHRDPVQEVVQKLWDGGHLELGTYSGWYSVPDETFFREEETVDRDGKHYLANPTVDQSKAPLEWVEEVGHFFKLSTFGEPLLDYYAKHPQTLRPETRRNETLSFIKMGLRDTSISRVQAWGIPLPAGVPESAGHVVYVWFPDALLNYATAPGYLSQDRQIQARFDAIWPPDVQLMSKDIFTRFHATLWPALLQALGLELPRELFAHGFWTVNGQKMSKRDPHTIIEPVTFSKEIAANSGCTPQIAVDALRYYCLREVTFGVDGDFSPEGCYTRYNADLANGLGNLLQRTLTMVHKYFEGRVPEGTGQDLGLLSTLAAERDLVAADYAVMNFSGALARIWEVIGRANKLIEEHKPWVKVKAGDTDGIRDLLRELLACCQWCAVTVTPVMPTTGAAIWSRLNLSDPLAWDSNFELLLNSGHTCAAPEPVFPRATLTKAVPNNQKATHKMNEDKLTPSPQTEQTSTATPAPAAPAEPVPVPEEPIFIGIEDFAKVELRVGVILEAERIPKADKLLRLQVDLGTEKRQVLAGIALHYEPDALVGKSVVIVANLAPRTMRGYESQGMVLASTNQETGAVVLVSPSVPVPAGSEVR